MNKPITWCQLWKRIGKQPLSITQHRNVQIKIDGQLKDCVLVYDSGTSFHLEVLNNNHNMV